MGVCYTHEPAGGPAATLVDQLIEDHHPMLRLETVIVVWRPEATVDKGRLVLGKARKIGGLNAFLSRPEPDSDYASDYFVIELAEDIWRWLTPAQQAALVDHELTHCVVDEGRLAIVGHDVEEFVSVIGRHGIWNDGLNRLVAAARAGQAMLPFARPDGSLVDPATGEVVGAIEST